MCEKAQVNGVVEVKPYACPPWVRRPEVIVCKDEEEALVVINNYKPGQVDIYADASVRNSRAGVGICATPLRALISKTVASFEQVDI